MGTIANIICGIASVNQPTPGSDEWIADRIYVSNEGQKAIEELAAYFIRINPENPHGSFRDRMVQCGMWKTWTTKAGKTKPTNVLERKSELKKIYPDSFREHAEWRVLCAFECLRVSIANTKALQKYEDDEAAKLAAAGVEGETQDTVQVEGQNTKQNGIVHVETTSVKDALGIINRVLAQMEMDESLSGFVEELRKAAAMLAA